MNFLLGVGDKLDGEAHNRFGQEQPLPTHAKCPPHLEAGDMKRPMKEFVASAVSFSPKSTPINGGDS